MESLAWGTWLDIGIFTPKVSGQDVIFPQVLLLCLGRAGQALALGQPGLGPPWPWATLALGHSGPGPAWLHALGLSAYL